MIGVVKNAWALLLGILLLMLGNGLQGTLLGVRGDIEGFSTNSMAWVMSGYFIGLLGGARLAPELIRRVGHVRVFAALASCVSACLILYSAILYPLAWFALRIAVGFCISGIYVVAESWLNDTATNENRGQALSAYIIVQMVGIVAAQMILNVADPAGYTLFILISVLVSLAVTPILLSINPAPVFHTTKPITLRKLFEISPLGVVGISLLGGIFAATFAMAAVFGTERGMTPRDISIFVATIYVGGLLVQYPIGWLSDRMDRRRLIVMVTAFGAAVALSGVFFSDSYIFLLAIAFVIGGVTNPLYSLLIAYTNDFLDHDDMAAAAGGMILANSIGAIAGPMLIGWLMTTFGANSYFAYVSALLALMASYAIYRSTRRPSPNVDEQTSYAPVVPTVSPVAVEVAQEVAIEAAQDEQSGSEEGPT